MRNLPQRSTRIPSGSHQIMAPGRTVHAVDHQLHIGLPGAVLGALARIAAERLDAKRQVREASRSRMAPLITTPAQPFATALSAIMSPMSAVRSEPPPSTTSTAPSPGVARVDLTRALSSKHLMVRTGPLKCDSPPRDWNCSAMESSSSPRSS